MRKGADLLRSIKRWVEGVGREGGREGEREGGREGGDEENYTLLFIWLRFARTASCSGVKCCLYSSTDRYPAGVPPADFVDDGSIPSVKCTHVSRAVGEIL